MEQSWNNAAAESLRFSAFAPKHCSIDLSFSFARGPRHPTRVPFSIFVLVSDFDIRISDLLRAASVSRSLPAVAGDLCG
jgi:hypothetical protein